MAKIAWIGLGVMGYPMAGHLQRSGNHEIHLYDVSSNAMQSWAKQYADNNQSIIHDSAKSAAENADFVFLCVGNDKDVYNVTMGENGALHAMKSGAFLIDHTTASADMARKLNEECKTKNINFIDAPVSGGQVGAQNGALAILCGCDDANNFDHAMPIMHAYGKNIQHMGNAGAGQLTKMVNQICLAGAVQALSEGLAFGKKAGLDMDKVLSVISGGAAQSWAMMNCGPKMLKDDYNHGFAVDWMRKDLGMCLSEANNNGALLPMIALIEQFYGQLQHNGNGRMDMSSLMTLLDK